MSMYFETTYSGEITAGGTAAVCPTCRARTGLTIHGRLGQPGRLRCRSGHDFAAPRGFDAVQLLLNAANDPRRVRTN
jgi:hypothetical protein